MSSILLFLAGYTLGLFATYVAIVLAFPKDVR